MTLQERLDAPMRQRRVDALRRCALRAIRAGLPMASTVNPFAPEAPPRMLGSTVLMVAAEVTGFTVGDLISHKRGQGIGYARQFAYWLIRQRTGVNYSRIAHLLNKTRKAASDGVRATNRRLRDDWPMIVAWRDRAAAKLSKIDTARRRQQEHTGTAHSYSRLARDDLHNGLMHHAKP